ncbi:MAG: sugar ABC transporter permease [Pyrinomonadaceae bacterium]
MSEEAKTKITATALRAYIMIAVLGLIWLYFHWATDYVFMTPRNLSNLMTQMSVTGIIAIGMLMVIVSGNIDLSVGSVLGFAGGIAAYGMTVLEFGLPAAIIAAVVIGIVIGIFHGTLTAYLNIPAFIVTLGGLLAWRGAVKWLLGGNTIPISDSPQSAFEMLIGYHLNYPELSISFDAIGNANLPVVFGWGLAVVATAFVLFMAYRKARSVKDYGLGEANYASELLKAIIPIGGIVAFIGVMNAYQGVPVPVLILVAVALIGGFLTNSTVFGRYLYAIGGNADAARLSGINNKRNILKVYALLGALTGAAALIFTARVGSAAPDAGVLKELDAIAACVIGGASLMGGRGTVFGACLGALIMASLDNGMSLLNVRDFMQDIIKGSILVAAVGLDMMGRKQS